MEDARDERTRGKGVPDKTTGVPTPVAGHPLTRYATVIPRRPPLSPCRREARLDVWRHVACYRHRLDYMYFT